MFEGPNITPSMSNQYNEKDFIIPVNILRNDFENHAKQQNMDNYK